MKYPLKTVGYALDGAREALNLLIDAKQHEEKSRRWNTDVGNEVAEGVKIHVTASIRSRSNRER